MLVDVAVFGTLLGLITIGFGFALATLLPTRVYESPDASLFLGKHPIWDSWWGMFGDYDRNTIYQQSAPPTPCITLRSHAASTTSTLSIALRSRTTSALSIALRSRGLHHLLRLLRGHTNTYTHTTRASNSVAVGNQLPTAVFAPTMLWIYEFFSVVLLMNLLVALMSDTCARNPQLHQGW